MADKSKPETWIALSWTKDGKPWQSEQTFPSRAACVQWIGDRHGRMVPGRVLNGPSSRIQEDALGGSQTMSKTVNDGEQR